MKVFIGLLAVLVLISVSAGKNQYKEMISDWGKMKAMEGCFGRINMNNWVLMMKKAKAKCSNTPAPELKLAMFANKVSTANALVNAGKDSKRTEFIDNLMREIFIKKMMRKQMMDLMGGDDDDFPFVAKFKGRYTRQADDDEDVDDEDMKDMHIAENMVAKLTNMEMKLTSWMGNMTCIMREIGAIDENMEIDADAMVKQVDLGKWSTEETGDGVDRTWLKEEVKSIIHMCKDTSDALPKSVLNNSEMPHYLTRLFVFKKCKKFHKKEACMISDVRNKMADNDVDIEELAEEMGKKEDTVATLMAFMVFGDM